MKSFTLSGSRNGTMSGRESHTIKCSTEGEARMIANTYFGGKGNVSTVRRDYFS